MKKSYSSPEMCFEILNTEDVLSSSSLTDPTTTEATTVALRKEKENVYKAASLFFENWL